MTSLPDPGRKSSEDPNPIPAEVRQIVAQLRKRIPYSFRLDGATYKTCPSSSVHRLYWHDAETNGLIFQSRDWAQYSAVVSFTVSELVRARESWNRSKTDAAVRFLLDRQVERDRIPKAPQLQGGAKRAKRLSPKRKVVQRLDWFERRRQYLSEKRIG